MEYDDGRMISIADLPGLIEGAHRNYGMGIKFLRHAERTKLLLYVLDINPFQLSHKYPERSPFETLLLLNKELDEYGHGMLEKPSILALNKIDTDKSGVKVDRLLDLIKNLPCKNEAFVIYTWVQACQLWPACRPIMKPRNGQRTSDLIEIGK
ncbi:GTP-binding protein 10-like protein [Elysia marginata]|uniref:GTP-binding protein 10-like protein n=1 Tax=Elysia marginata TaxID=1093978 RepID=A0AAV4F4Q2_9GAST|nr:GTP-binding protein 10-like protein [Elysia marginata]